MEHMTLSRGLCEISHFDLRKGYKRVEKKKFPFQKKVLAAILTADSATPNVLMTLCFIFCACFYLAPSKAYIEEKSRLILM